MLLGFCQFRGAHVLQPSTVVIWLYKEKNLFKSNSVVTLEKRYYNREGYVISIHRGGDWVRVSTVDPVSLKEFVVAGDLDDDRDELVEAVFQKMAATLGDRIKLQR